MNFIFDLGNVLIEWNKDKILTKVTSDKEEFALFDEIIFKSGLWNDIDNGIVKLEEAELLLLEQLGKSYQEKIHTIIWRWTDYVDFFPEVYASIQELKRLGHSFYILSNTSSLFYSMLDHQLLSIKPLLDGFVLSFEEKLMKPNHAIYKVLLDRYQLNPSESLFFDDLKQNVDAAKELGIRAYQIKERQDIQRLVNEFI